ncbi:MAG: hypothetical protein MJZ24_04905 [Paludibacteraceae bacterium]|nr:hypothetical protein [Paludibacteraceae bacterium]
MIKIETVFFGTEGTCLTSTSAQHIANMAKELVKCNLRELEGMHFVEKQVTALGADKGNVLQKGTSKEELDSVKKKLVEIGEANSLIAWLREGIKAKNDYLNLIENMGKEEYCQLKGVDPESVKFDIPDEYEFLEENGFDYEPIYPERQTCDENQTVAEWSEEDRIKYFSLKDEYEAINMAIDRINDMMEELSNALDEPVNVSGDGDKALLYKKSPNIKLKDINDTLEYLTSKRQNINEGLHNFAARIKADISKKQQELNEAYEQEIRQYREYANAYHETTVKFREAIVPEIRNKEQIFMNELEHFRKLKSKEVGNLKIVIPNSLKEIFDKVSTLGK